MMELALRELENMGGIRHACLMRRDELLVSTFPNFMYARLCGLAQLFNQMLSCIANTGRDYNEIQIELEDRVLTSVRLGEQGLIIIQTEKEVNLALIDQAFKTMKPHLLEVLQDKNAPQQLKFGVSVEPPVAIAETTTLVEWSDEKQQGLRLLLAEYIGPAALIVLSKVVQEWTDELPNHQRELSVLLERLLSFIDNKEKAEAFRLRASTFLNL